MPANDFHTVCNKLPPYQRNVQDGLVLTSTGGTLFRAFSHSTTSGKCILIPAKESKDLNHATYIYETNWEKDSKHYTKPLDEYVSIYHQPLISLAIYIDQLENEVEASLKLSKSELDNKIKNYPAIPEKVTITTVGFKRNPHVIAQKLLSVNGICECCEKPAPFFKKGNPEKPYLEVHHKNPLSEGGEDTLDNTIALCPNCHRKKHFG
jgi:5-methylcytosine-specific restriction protein A